MKRIIIDCTHSGHYLKRENRDTHICSEPRQQSRFSIFVQLIFPNQSWRFDVDTACCVFQVKDIDCSSGGRLQDRVAFESMANRSYNWVFFEAGSGFVKTLRCMLQKWYTSFLVIVKILSGRPGFIIPDLIWYKSVKCIIDRVLFCIYDYYTI